MNNVIEENYMVEGETSLDMVDKSEYLNVLANTMDIVDSHEEDLELVQNAISVLENSPEDQINQTSVDLLNLISKKVGKTFPHVGLEEMSEREIFSKEIAIEGFKEVAVKIKDTIVLYIKKIWTWIKDYFTDLLQPYGFIYIKLTKQIEKFDKLNKLKTDEIELEFEKIPFEPTKYYKRVFNSGISNTSEGLETLISMNIAAFGSCMMGIESSVKGLGNYNIDTDTTPREIDENVIKSTYDSLKRVVSGGLDIKQTPDSIIFGDEKYPLFDSTISGFQFERTDKGIKTICNHKKLSYDAFEHESYERIKPFHLNKINDDMEQLGGFFEMGKGFGSVIKLFPGLIARIDKKKFMEIDDQAEVFDQEGKSLMKENFDHMLFGYKSTIKAYGYQLCVMGDVGMKGLRAYTQLLTEHNKVLENIIFEKEEKLNKEG